MTNKNIGILLTLGVMCFGRAGVAAGQDLQQPTVAMTADMAAIPAPVMSGYRRPAKRPAALPVLYGALAAIQLWDVHSTSAALKAGAREANPGAAPFADNTASMLGLKASTTAATIFFTERLWKSNRAAAIVMMTAINGATAAVALHNMNNARIAAARR